MIASHGRTIVFMVLCLQYAGNKKIALSYTSRRKNYIRIINVHIFLVCARNFCKDSSAVSFYFLIFYDLHFIYHILYDLIHLHFIALQI